ncbi:unnamed protein product [Ambrosiozyma monospora]|uniref:Unnamed protein product n=1 Tax=Ambrosiozyma monospora TaxID=43982 RepID=A0ACB5U325_AMBMO|nr:unnamed protein product [Ambrosiozyma monospora]
MSDFSRFVSQHKAALIVSAVVGVTTVAGTVYYLNQQKQLPPSPPPSSKKSKNKRKKQNKKKKASEAKTTLYPVDPQTGLPKITDEIVNTLSDEEKSSWALSLKESGNEYFKKKDFETAIAYYTNALQCRIDPVFYANRSACYAALDKDDKVVEDTTEALKINPSYNKCLLRRAHAYENMEKYPDAMFDLTALTIHGGMNDHSNEVMLERVLKKHSLRIDQEEYSNLPKELPSASSLSSFFGAFAPPDIDLDESKHSRSLRRS